MSALVIGCKDKASSNAPAAASSPARPRDEVLDEIAARLAALEATIGELRSPAVEEVLVDFVNLIRCRLQPLRPGIEKPVGLRSGGNKSFTDDDPENEPAEVEADEATASDSIHMGS